jgi:hypothetical protein
MKRYASRLVSVAVVVAGSLPLAACRFAWGPEAEQRQVVSSRPTQIGEEWTEFAIDPSSCCERYFDTIEIEPVTPVDLPVRLPFPPIEYSIEQLDGATVSGMVSSLMTSPEKQAWELHVEFQQDRGVARRYHKLRLRSKEPILAKQILLRSWSPPEV